MHKRRFFYIDTITLHKSPYIWPLVPEIWVLFGAFVFQGLINGLKLFTEAKSPRNALQGQEIELKRAFSPSAAFAMAKVWLYFYISTWYILDASFASETS